MKSKKLTLSDLKVNSFITVLSDGLAKTAKGGTNADAQETKSVDDKAYPSTYTANTNIDCCHTCLPCDRPMHTL